MAKERAVRAGLTSADREAVVEILAQGTNNLHEAYYDAPNWGDARRYLSVVAMVGSLASETMTSVQKNHIKRMIAHKALSLPKGGRKPPSTKEFMKQAETVASKEIELLRTLQIDRASLTPSFKKALEDIENVDKKVVTDPILLSLRRSLRAKRED